MGKHGQDAHGGAMPGSSLLGVVAGLLESGMIDVFGTGSSTGDGGGRASPKSYGDGDADHASSGRPITADESSQRHVMMADSGLSFSKRSPDSDPYCDMPELDRLGIITCPVSSEEEEDFKTAESRSSNGSAHLAARRTTTVGVPSGRAKNAWGSRKCQDFSDSNASTLVPSLTPTFFPSTLHGGGESDPVDTLGRNSQTWGTSHYGSTNKHSNKINVNFPRKAAPEVAEESRETPMQLSAIRSDSSVSSCESRSRVLPAPLDLSAIAGPTPPKSFTSNTSSSAPRSDRPVVLQSAALDQLNRMGGAKQARGRSRETARRQAQRALQEEDDSDVNDSDEHNGRHREDSSPLLSSEEGSNSSNRTKQDGRGRPAFRGRGARPRTWTELDAANFSHSPSPQRDDTVENALPPPRLVQQPAGAVGGPGAELVSPGALSRPSFATLSTVEPDGDRDDGDRDDVFGNSHLIGSSGGRKSAQQSNGRGGNVEPMRAQVRGRLTDDDMDKPPSKLAEVAAELAMRGSISTAELVPGLGRSAFENISAFQSTNGPTRKLATAAATAETVAAVVTRNGRGDAGAVRVSSGIGGAQLEQSGNGSEKCAGYGVQDLKPTADSVAALPSRSGGGESNQPSKVSLRVPRTAYLPQVPRVPQPDASPPALNQPHAPGRVFRPMKVTDGMQQHGARRAKGGEGGMGSVKIPPFRLSSSNRLTSFSSMKDSAPASPSAAAAAAAAAASVALATAEAECLRNEGAPASRGNGERVLLTGSSRPQTIDMLSSFGSNAADEKLHTRVAPSDTRAAAGGRGHQEDDVSHIETLVDVEGDTGGGDGINSLKNKNRGKASGRSRSRTRTGGENGGGGSGNSQSGRKSHQRRGSRNSDAPSTQRSRSRPRNRDGRNSSRGSSTNDRRRRQTTDDELNSEHRSSRRSPQKSTTSSRQSTSGSRSREEGSVRGRRGRDHRRRPSSNSANVMTGSDDAEGMTRRDETGGSYCAEADVTSAQYGNVHGETAGSRVSRRPSRGGHASSGRHRRASSCSSNIRREKPRSEILERRGSGDDNGWAAKSSKEERERVRQRATAAEREERGEASAREVSEGEREAGLLFERESNAMAGHRRRKSEQIAQRTRGGSVDGRDPFASLKNRVFRSEPPPPRQRSSSVGAPARKSRALFGMPLFGSGAGRRHQQGGDHLSLQQVQQHGRRPSRYFRSSDRRALNSSGHADDVYSREVVSGCASFFKRKIFCQIDGPPAVDHGKRPVRFTEMSVDGTDSMVSFGNSSILGPPARMTEDVNGRSSAQGADGRQLSQLYACRQSDSGSREIDFKEFEISRANGGDDFTEERNGSLRVQHLLRTSRVHTVRMKPSSGRSDISPDRGS